MRIGIGIGIGFQRAPAFDVLSLVPDLWLDASQETDYDDDEAVPSITDWSGHTRPAIQGTEAAQPHFKADIQNGMPVYRFDGVDDTASASFTLNNPVTVFSVLKQRSNPGTNRRAWDGVNGNRMSLLIEGGSSVVYAFAGTGLNFGTIGTTNFHRVALVFDATSSGQLDANAAVTGDAGANNNPGGIRLAHEGVTFAAIDLAELIIVPRVCSAGEIAGAMAYLKAKWGL